MKRNQFEKLENDLLGSAPIEKFIWIDRNKEAEWESLDDNIKKSVMNNLDKFCERLSLENAVVTLACAINELNKRLQKLESNEVK